MYKAQQAVVNQAKLKKKIKNLLFATVNLARHLKTKAKIALQKANKKFKRRFRKVKRIVAARKLKITSVNLKTIKKV